MIIRRCIAAIEGIDIVMGNIVEAKADAIVNPTNEALRAGGAVSSAIHRAAGLLFGAERAKLNGCKIGEAKRTGAYNLKHVKHIIYTVPPRWTDGSNSEEYNLAQCYLNSIKLAVEAECSSLAFPCIGTGAMGFPDRRAAEIAFNVLLDFHLNADCGGLKFQIFCFDETAFRIYRRLFKRAIIQMMLKYYSPEGMALYNDSEFQLYFAGMIKLRDLEDCAEQFDYQKYMPIFLKDGHGSKPGYYNSAMKGAETWDYQTCLAYIFGLQRDAYWSGGNNEPHREQSMLGSVRLVLMRMLHLLDACENDACKRNKGKAEAEDSNWKVQYREWMKTAIGNYDLLAAFKTDEMNRLEEYFGEGVRKAAIWEDEAFFFLNLKEKTITPMTLLAYAFGGMYGDHPPYGKEAKGFVFHASEYTLASLRML